MQCVQLKAAPRPPRVRPEKRVVACRPRSYQNNQHPRRDGFWTGFALGGALFGAAGFFFAPQISRAILNEQQKFKAPKWLEENAPPVTKEELEEKINQLHSAINDVASQIGPEEKTTSQNSSSDALDVTSNV